MCEETYAGGVEEELEVEGEGIDDGEEGGVELAYRRDVCRGQGTDANVVERHGDSREKVGES
jgi:hypothetical protein